MGPLALASAVVGSLAFARLTQLVRPSVVIALEALVVVTVVACALPQLLGGAVLSDAAAKRLEGRLALDVFRATPYRATVGHEYVPRTADLAILTRPARDMPVLRASEGVTVDVQRDTPRLLELVVHSTAPGELCLARWSFPWWQVQVDGQPQAAVRSKRGCVAVSVFAGTHHVVARVLPPRARQVGLAVSVIALLTGLLSLLRMRRPSQAQ
jgi:hypothetical protein